MSSIAYLSVVLLGLVHFLHGHDDFYFSVSPQSESVSAGASVRLRCRVSSADHIVYAWTLNDRPVDNTTRRFQDGADLVIRRADRLSDSGQFVCTATNASTGFSVASLPADLDVQWISNVSQILPQNESALPASALSITSGEELTLRCRTEGSPEVHFDWFKNGAKLGRFKNKRLHWSKVTRAESGSYWCVARNSAGSTRLNQPIAVQVLDGHAPRLQAPPNDIVATPGSRVNLECGFNPHTEVVWMFPNGSAVTNSSRFSSGWDGKLTITNVSPNDAGFYKCRAGEDLEFGATVHIAYLQDFTEVSLEPPVDENRQIFRAEYSSLEVDCVSPEGLPSPVVWWEGPDGLNLTTSTGTSSMLSISRLNARDSGTYTCWAENSSGTKSTKLQLIVTTVPVFQQHPSSLSVNEGEDATFSCSFLGTAYPGSRVSWLKDGKKISESLSSQGSRNSTLKIKTTLSVAGNYACLVETIGLPVVRSQSATLIVRETLKFSPRPMNKKLELGSSAKVHCRAQGQPAPVVRWVKEGRPLFQWPLHVEDLNGTLYFHGVQQQDQGIYTCVATNTQGIINATITIDIIVLPRFTTLPENPTFVREGSRVFLHCAAEGEPQPAIQWDKDAVLNGFDPERFTVFANGSLLINSVKTEDEGRYGCTAGNAGGFKREEIRLLIQGSDDGDDSSFLTKTVGITLGAAAGYILLAAGLLLWCRLRRKRKKKKAAAAAANSANAAEAALLPKNDQHEAKSSKYSGGSYRSNGSSSGSTNGTAASAYDKWSTPRHFIDVGDFVGKGDFGEVRKGWVKVPNSSTSRVLLRCLSTRDEELMTEFRRQADMFQRAISPHLTSVLGFSRDCEPQMLIIDYSDQLILKTLLRNPSTSTELTPQLLLSVTSQIARGMSALADARFVHKDLGTRNVLVSFSGVNQVSVKITSLCLNKEPFSSDYCRVKNQLLPLRWLPHEAVFEDEFSTKSDVWMFAVTAWEIFQQGQLPFATETDETVLRFLSNKTLKWDLSALPNLPQTLRDLLTKCWSYDPQMRPSFNTICESLNQHGTEL